MWRYVNSFGQAYGIASDRFPMKITLITETQYEKYKQ